MLSHPYPGKYIAFAGGEGCGKTTQMRILVQRMGLDLLGKEVVETREPGGTEKAEEIRRAIFVRTENGETALPITEAFLFAAARHQNLERTVRPALEKGAIVVSDRSVYCSEVYQGYVRGLGIETVRQLNKLATGDLLPDLVICPDLDPEIGLRRKQVGEINRFEEEGLAFHRKVRQGYLEVAKLEAERFLVLDGTLSAEAQSRLIWERVKLLLGEDGEARRELSSKRERM